MFKLVASFVLLLCCTLACAQSNNPKYDKSLADSLGADDYGMKRYVLVILKTGPAKVDKPTTDSLFAGHMKNMGRMVDMGKLIVAGPLQKNDNNYRGIFILNVRTIDEAKTLLETDPAIKGKVLEAECYSWYGSAALPMYLPAVPRVEKKSF
jgi:uncharacterized protein YciI